MKEFEIGSICKDTVTGFQGVVIARSSYLFNCDAYFLQPKELKDGAPVKACLFDCRREPRRRNKPGSRHAKSASARSKPAEGIANDGS